MMGPDVTEETGMEVTVVSGLPAVFEVVIGTGTLPVDGAAEYVNLELDDVDTVGTTTADVGLSAMKVLAF